MNSWDVLCLGYACYDLAMLLDGHPEADRKYTAASSWESGGGPAANAAWLLARWGAACAFGGVLGEDLYGRRALQELEEAGVDTRLVEVRAAPPTPLSVLLIDRRTGTRTVVNRREPCAADGARSSGPRGARPELPAAAAPSRRAARRRPAPAALRRA